MRTDRHTTGKQSSTSTIRIIKYYFTQKNTLILVCHAANKKLTTSLQLLVISQMNLLVLENDWKSTLKFIALSKSGFLNDI